VKTSGRNYNTSRISSTYVSDHLVAMIAGRFLPDAVEHEELQRLGRNFGTMPRIQASSWRSIVMPSGKWRWRFASGGIALRDPDNRSFIVKYPQLGFSYNDIERGVWKRTLSITPEHAKQAIAIIEREHDRGSAKIRKKGRERVPMEVASKRGMVQRNRGRGRRSHHNPVR
jgi:hypothetical protein